MVNLSFQAKQRLSFLEFYQVVKDVALTCRVLSSQDKPFTSGRKDMIPIT
jgi:hypothetical protein